MLEGTAPLSRWKAIAPELIVDNIVSGYQTAACDTVEDALPQKLSSQISINPSE